MTNEFVSALNLTFDTVADERMRLLQFIQATDVGHLIMNLNLVNKFDSAGMALLIEAKRLCSLHEKVIEITNMPSVVEDLVKFYGVETIF